MKEPYPISLILKGRRVVVVGGGEVAERKILTLLDTGARITVVAPQCTERITALALRNMVELTPRGFVDDDLEGSCVVFAATNSRDLNRKVARMARAKSCLVNCVDTPEECDFFVPSFFRRGSLTFTVSTGGKIPALAKKLNQELREHYGEAFADYVELLADARESIKKEGTLAFHEKRELIEKLIKGPLLRLLKDGKRKEAFALIRDVQKEPPAGKGIKERYPRD